MLESRYLGMSSVKRGTPEASCRQNEFDDGEPDIINLTISTTSTCDLRRSRADELSYSEGSTIGCNRKIPRHSKAYHRPQSDMNRQDRA
jgi:hypothetical protein